MPKVDKGKVVTVYLPESQLEAIAATGETRSEVIRQALAAWFNRMPSDQEIALAVDFVIRAAAARARREEADDEPR